MNKLLCTTAALAALSFLPVAHAGSPARGDGGWHLGVHAGQGYYNGNADLDTQTYRVDVGYRWSIGEHNSLGVQVGYVRPDTLQYDDGYQAFQTKIKAWTVGATYHLTFGGTATGMHGFLSARAGYMHWTRDEAGRDMAYVGYGQYVSYTYASSASGTGSYVGVGVGLDFNQHVGVGLYYNYYLADLYEDEYGNYSADGLSVPSLGLEVRF